MGLRKISALAFYGALFPATLLQRQTDQYEHPVKNVQHVFDTDQSGEVSKVVKRIIEIAIIPKTRNTI
jgi:hypothetical protein